MRSAAAATWWTPKAMQVGAGTGVAAVAAPGKLGALAMSFAFALAAVSLTGGGYWADRPARRMLVLLTCAGQPVVAGVGLRVTGGVDAGVLLGALAGGASWALSMAVPRGVFQLRGGARGVVTAGADKPSGPAPLRVTAVCGLVLAVASMVIVADYWGAMPAR